MSLKNKADYKKLLLQGVLHWRHKQPQYLAREVVYHKLYIFEEHLGEAIQTIMETKGKQPPQNPRRELWSTICKSILKHALKN